MDLHARFNPFLLTTNLQSVFIQLCNNNSKSSLILKAFLLYWHILVDIGLYWHLFGLDFKFFKVFLSYFSDNTIGKRINDSKEKYVYYEVVFKNTCHSLRSLNLLACACSPPVLKKHVYMRTSILRSVTLKPFLLTQPKVNMELDATR